MADKVFKFSNLNPFRWTLKNAVFDPRYNTRPFDEVVDSNKFAGPYFQKWQTNDITKLQFLSDYALTLKFYKFNSYYGPFADTEYLTIPVTEIIGFPIDGVTFTAYESTIDFSEFAEGIYYSEISYTDDDENVITWQSSPIEVKVIHIKTLLYEYWNTYNDKGVIFDTGIKFCLRIEGNIRAFTPSSLDQIFEDQHYNTTTENSIPFRTFTNFIGRAEGLPDWIIDKMNLVYSLNYKSIDGTFYNKVDGTKFEMVRPNQTEDEDGFMSIQIIQQDNFFLDKFTTGEIPDTGEIKVITDCRIFDEVGESFSIAGLFDDNMALIGISLENKGLDEFTIKIGTSAGGNQIAEFDISDEEVTSFLNVKHVFNAAVTMYITVPTGVNLKLTPIWYKLDATAVTPTTPVAAFPKNYMGMYYEVDPGDFDIHWSGTGLGNVGTAWEGCAIMGTNGLPAMPGAMPICWDINEPLSRGAFLGVPDNNLFLSKDELPAEGIGMFTTDVNPTGGDVPDEDDHVSRARAAGNQALNYEVVKGVAGTFVGVTENMGQGDPLVITPYSLVTLFFVKITD